MKNSLFYLFAIGMTILMTSCAMVTEVHFNKNYSGTYSQTIDFSGVSEIAKEFGGGEDTDEMLAEAMTDEQREKMISTISSVDGISNVAFDRSDKSVVGFSFDFDDVESLNNAFADLPEAMGSDDEMMSQVLAGMDGVGSMGIPVFTREGKTISVGASFPKDKLPEEAMSELDEMGGADMIGPMLDEMMDYSVHLTFDKKVKEVKIDGLELISQDKHSVKVRIDLGRFVEGVPYSLEVRN